MPRYADEPRQPGESFPAWRWAALALAWVVFGAGGWWLQSALRPLVVGVFGHGPGALTAIGYGLHAAPSAALAATAQGLIIAPATAGPAAAWNRARRSMPAALGIVLAITLVADLPLVLTRGVVEPLEGHMIAGTINGFLSFPVLLALKAYFGFAVCLVLDRGAGPITALRLSGSLTRGWRWRLAGTSFLIESAAFVLALVGGVLTATHAAGPELENATGWLVRAGFFSAIWWALSARIYLRSTTNGADATQSESVPWTGG